MKRFQSSVNIDIGDFLFLFFFLFNMAFLCGLLSTMSTLLKVMVDDCYSGNQLSCSYLKTWE